MKELLGMVPRRVLAAVAAAVAVTAGVHFAVLAPMARETVAMNSRARVLAADVAQVSQASQALTEWVRQNPLAAGADPRAIDSMSPELAVPALLQQLSSLGGRHQIQVLSIRPEAPDPPLTVDTGDGAPRTYVRIPMHLTARAQYRRLGEFLEDLQRGGGLALVRAVRLTAGQEPGMVTVEIWIDAFGRIS